ncbi:MAG TPA: hypothetical protein VIM99_01290, partial [Blastocatellia bacterium]
NYTLRRLSHNTAGDFVDRPGALELFCVRLRARIRPESGSTPFGRPRAVEITTRNIGDSYGKLDR